MSYINKKKIFIIISFVIFLIFWILGILIVLKNNQSLSIEDLKKCYQMRKQNNEASDSFFYCYKDSLGRLKIFKDLPNKINNQLVIFIIDTPQLFRGESLRGLEGGRLAYTDFLWKGGISSVCVAMPDILQEKGLIALQQDILFNYKIKDAFLYFCSSFDVNNLQRNPLIIGGKFNNSSRKLEKPKIFVDYNIPIRDTSLDYFINNYNSYVLISK